MLYWLLSVNRLNMIHEGAHGIQALDLLGRRVLMENGRGLPLLAARVSATAGRAENVPGLVAYGKFLLKALAQVGAATRAAWSTGNPAVLAAVI
jgi:hypothetical protein